jgi:hypothetical protein
MSLNTSSLPSKKRLKMSDWSFKEIFSNENINVPVEEELESLHEEEPEEMEEPEELVEEEPEELVEEEPEELVEEEPEEVFEEEPEEVVDEDPEEVFEEEPEEVVDEELEQVVDEELEQVVDEEPEEVVDEEPEEVIDEEPEELEEPDEVVEEEPKALEEPEEVVEEEPQELEEPEEIVEEESEEVVDEEPGELNKKGLDEPNEEEQETRRIHLLVAEHQALLRRKMGLLKNDPINNQNLSNVFSFQQFSIYIFLNKKYDVNACLNFNAGNYNAGYCEAPVDYDCAPQQWRAMSAEQKARANRLALQVQMGNPAFVHVLKRSCQTKKSCIVSSFTVLYFDFCKMVRTIYIIGCACY